MQLNFPQHHHDQMFVTVQFEAEVRGQSNVVFRCYFFLIKSISAAGAIIVTRHRGSQSWDIGIFLEFVTTMVEAASLFLNV